MGAGTFTSHERVERDGYLVSFEGEVMTIDEAVQRGLVSQKQTRAAGGEKPKRKTTEKAGK